MVTNSLVVLVVLVSHYNIWFRDVYNIIVTICCTTKQYTDSVWYGSCNKSTCNKICTSFNGNAQRCQQIYWEQETDFNNHTVFGQ